VTAPVQSPPPGAAPAAPPATVTLRIDGVPVTIERGRTVFQAAESIGKTPPHFCYHRDLSVPANCRMCLCEIAGNPKLQTSCSTIAADGMDVSFESARVQEAVAGVLEFEFKNHPLDCPVCDQVGECKLQQYYMEVGLYESELETPKIRKDKVKQLGKITLDAERCVLCSRCVRFGHEVTGTDDFAIVNRGDHAEIATFDDRPITNPYALNYADLCPVGALTSSDFRFRRRVYYLDPVATVCPECSNGCSIFADRSLRQLFRFRPRVNPEVNRSWMCDEGRLSYRTWNEPRGRIERPMAREEGRTAFVTWERAVEVLAQRLRAGGAFAAMAHPRMTNEDLLALRALAEALGGSVEFRLGGCDRLFDDFEDRLLRKRDKNPNTRGAIEVLLAGDARRRALGDPARRDEEPGRRWLEQLPAGGVLLVFRWDEEALGAAGMAAVERASFVVFCGPWEPAWSGRCDLLLPAARTGERDGSFTNFAGRVQAIRPALRPYGVSREPWAWLDEVGRALGHEIGGPSAAATFDRLADRSEGLRGLRFAALGATGLWVAGAGGNGRSGRAPEPAGGGPADSGPVAPGAATKPAPGGPGSPASSSTGGQGAR
jgi:NADH-quinone oxidoreductase subunit G